MAAARSLSYAGSGCYQWITGHDPVWEQDRQSVPNINWDRMQAQQAQERNSKFRNLDERGHMQSHHQHDNQRGSTHCIL